MLDFSRHPNHVLALDPGTATAVVEPGVILDDLQRTAPQHGLRFGLDPSTHSRCTIGGMVGNNACGSRALGYGRTADNVIVLGVVTGTGERLEPRDPNPRSSPTVAALDVIVRANLALIRTELGRFSRQVSGYSVEHLLPERGFDVAKVLVGTEGTWGIIERATVRLVRAPASTVLVVLGYPDMAAAVDAVPSLLPLDPVAIEGTGRGSWTSSVDAWRGAGTARGAGWLFVELGGIRPSSPPGPRPCWPERTALSS